MKTWTTSLALALTLLPPGTVPSAAQAPPASGKPAASSGLDTALIERLTGAKGSLDAAEGVFKVSIPRTDLDVRVGGVRLHPAWGSPPGRPSTWWRSTTT